MKENPKISAVMCTYGRFKCVERTLNCFLSQSYSNKELIIYNTDVDSPYLDAKCELMPHGVLIINNNIDLETKKEYTNVGAIRRDALKFAGGDYVVTWDDDDIFLPYFMQQGIDRMKETGLPSFKPEKSFFFIGDELKLVKNTLEASVIADINKVREYGYLLETGKEGLAWYTKMRDNKELDEHDSHCIPSYCFNWGDGAEMLAPHKQSGDINNPDNFCNHKKASEDKVNGRELKVHSYEYMYDKIFREYYFHLFSNEIKLDKDLVFKYLY
jgi:glycosyltransferase involved in cell wall biosynthesis